MGWKNEAEAGRGRGQGKVQVHVQQLQGRGGWRLDEEQKQAHVQGAVAVCWCTWRYS